MKYKKICSLEDGRTIKCTECRFYALLATRPNADKFNALMKEYETDCIVESEATND